MTNSNIITRLFNRSSQIVMPETKLAFTLTTIVCAFSLITLPSPPLKAQTTNAEPTHIDSPNIKSNYFADVIELEDRLEDWQPDEKENQAKAKTVLGSIYYHETFFLRMIKAQEECKQDDFDLYRATLLKFLNSDRATLEPDIYFTHHIDKIKDIVNKITFKKPCTKEQSVTTTQPPKGEIKKGDTKKPEPKKTTVKKKPNCNKPQNTKLKYCKARAAAIQRAKERSKKRKAAKKGKGTTKKNNVTKQIIDVGTQVLIKEGAKQIFKKNNKNNNNNQNNWSDSRLKEDIKHLTTLSNGVRLYSFRYLWEETIYVGVMAQDLLNQTHTIQAVIKTNRGYYQVNYQKLGLKMASIQQWHKVGIEAVVINHNL